MDFATLPPEINSLRIYTGPGAGPMLAAAAAWEGLTAELRSAAYAYQSLIHGLTETAWRGPSSLSMVAAVTPYIAWLTGSAAQAEQTAAQATMAAIAYESAFDATVPPPVVAANRALLASLIATNFLGQNTAAIAATEAHYAEMWAQDVAAMSGYAAAAAVASELEPFSEPPNPVNPVAPAEQLTQSSVTGTARAAVTQTMSSLLGPASVAPLDVSVNAAAAPGTTSLASTLNSLDSFITGPLSPLSLFPVAGVPTLLGIQSFLLPFNAQNLGEAVIRQGRMGTEAVLLSQAPAVAGRSLASAGMGNAGLVGKLSVPQNWAVTAPSIRSMAAVLSSSSATAPAVALEGGGNLLGPMGLSALAGRATAGGITTRSVSVAGAAAGEATTATIIVLPADE